MIAVSNIPILRWSGNFLKIPRIIQEKDAQACPVR